MPNFGVSDDDELGGLAPSTKPVPTPSPVPAAGKAPASDVESIDWDFAKPYGYGDGLERIRPKAGETLRFALVPGYPAKAGVIHYVSLNGKTARIYLCGGPACEACRSGIEAKRSTVALAVQYTNADQASGKLAADVAPVYKVGYLSLSTTNHDDLIRAPTEGVSPLEVDYRMSYDGKRFGFHVVGNKSRHSQLGETAKITAMAAPFAARLPGKLGSPIPANSYVTPTTPPTGRSQQADNQWGTDC